MQQAELARLKRENARLADDSQHVFEGMVKGMKFYQRQLEAKSYIAVVTPAEPLQKRKVHFINGTHSRIDEIESSKLLTAAELTKKERKAMITKMALKEESISQKAKDWLRDISKT